MQQKSYTNSSAYVDRLRLTFPGEESLLFKDLSFNISTGEKVLLLGPSGCGKSTLLQVLSGIIPHSIEVPLKYDAIKLPSRWGFVFQDPDSQFCMPYVDEELAFVLENLSIPKEHMQAYMTDILERVGLQFADLHIEISTLSQGMKQRLALASVLLLEPEVLFLDEPSALLDPEGTKQIWDTVKRAAISSTILIVEHKIEHVIDMIDRVVLFDNSGNILADDEPNIIFQRHKDKLIEYGIWYPDVWLDYLQSEAYRTIVQSRNEVRAHQDGMNPACKLQFGNNRAEPILSLQDFAGYYEDIRKIYVSACDVYSGEWIAIVGANGAGKSTLLLSLMQIIRTSGTYYVSGKKIASSRKKRWFKALSSKVQRPPAELAFVFQNPEMQFLTDSIYNEMAYESRQERMDENDIARRIEQMLTAFDLNVSHERHPYHLSLGQKRRLSVATAMMRERPVLLLDEPTFGQDAKNTFAMLEKLEQLRSNGTTIIMITHDMHIANSFADRVWQIDDGKLLKMTVPVPILREVQLT
ncbi:energy-coupling factor ABC transporter ATP-binding protein [Paenibacillus alvei]|uniref:ABC transporter ATP-binding protein n=1 Tax=Paenibacillus alvei TaxID=44250 RepID=UPI0021D3BCF6|nr:ABC transporter ATP-binding protein [Paenibacillus alvei]MCY9543421.1 energy-coupling factor ABC transporter ATP-binding protein [Paenibacillus alvei]MCY9704509.1 energy-coupling factor ABC transporter ATP-binding protein [Paenibacillus alvei]MCY9732831.1 energy-coupling factor ABC transporter ATP-binding protein [Paenibacillus alvei]MEC0079564.1 ABC transporter ATP-binding protein [Paenibacillus alvei]